MSDLLVILGAGASFDALPEGDDRPPLAKELFDPRFENLQRSLSGVEALKGTILRRMAEGHSLESVLGELAHNNNPHIRRQVAQIPIYLKMLFAIFSDVPPDTYYEFITPIQERDISVTFVTLNYDTILDRAIERTYGSHIFSMDSYVTNATDWTYIKLHGSVNWGYLTDIQYDQLEVQLDRIDQPVEDSEILFLESAFDHQFEGWLIYPALAIPTDRKDSSVCPDTHVLALRTTLESDPAILVVGNQGRDAALMDILQESAPRGSSKPIHVVDAGNASGVTSRFREALGRIGPLWEIDKFFASPKIGDSPITWSDVGFRQFVKSGEAERFFDEVKAASKLTAGRLSHTG